MLYLISFTAVIIFVVLFLHHRNKTSKRNRLEQLRKEWGQPKTSYFSFERIEKYCDLLSAQRCHRLSSQTQNDIDFQEIFAFIDRTSSRVGQQYLFRKIKHPVYSQETLNAFNARVNFFSKNPALREKVQEDLARLNHRDAYFITSLLQEKLLEKPWWFNFLIVNLILTIGLLAFSITYPGLLIVLILPVGISMFLHYWNKGNSFQFVRSFPQLNILMSVARTVMQRDITFKDARAKNSLQQLNYFRSKSSLLSLGSEDGLRDELSQVFTYFIELIKVIFLVEVFTLYHLIRELEAKRDSIRTLFDYIGELDAAISVASLRAGSLKTCEPDLSAPAKTLSLKNVYHPLIENCVTNDVTIDKNGILITGSNMSGKTTFLRTVILNSILAQTIFTCFADEFKSPALKQFSSIRIDDSLMEAKSYYMEEVILMGSLIKEAESLTPNLFVLDEVFKGTNTVERIAAAKAILSFLNRGNNLVIVSTHDGELSDLLKTEYDLYHFTETIEGGELIFDHKLKPGPLKTRNAIKILELSDYPKEIIAEANRLSKNMVRSGSWWLN